MAVKDVGDLWSRYFYVRDITGALADATAVTATLTLPDGTVKSSPADLTVTHPTTGTYLVTYPTALSQLLEHRYYVQATGANACAESGSFFVRSGTSLALISLDDARSNLGYDAGDVNDDEQIRDYLDVVTDLIESKIGPVASRTVTEDVEIWRDFFFTRQPPVSLTSLTPVRTGGIVLNVADYQVLSTGKVVRKDGAWMTSGAWNLYTVVYVSGQTVAPRYLQAARLLLQHLWDTQRPVGLRPNLGGVDAVSAPFSWPNRVVELLTNDTLTGIA